MIYYASIVMPHYTLLLPRSHTIRIKYRNIFAYIINQTRAQLNPYLNFENVCRETMNFYQPYFSGEPATSKFK